MIGSLGNAKLINPILYLKLCFEKIPKKKKKRLISHGNFMKNETQKQRLVEPIEQL